MMVVTTESAHAARNVRVDTSRYTPLVNIRDESVGIACTIVAGLLCKAGTAAAQQMFALKQAHDRGQAPAGGFDAAVRCAGVAIDAFESSVNLDRNMIPAYSGLVWLLGSIGRVDDAVKYAREGLVAVR